MKAKLNGLILAGGKSTRMGTDKGELNYHGKPQREYVYQQLAEFCDAVYVSIRSDQTENLAENFHAIVDNDEVNGPLNGMLSAHRKFPEVAWLVVATDLPFVDKNSIKNLIDHRNSEKIATAYATQESKLPEPVFAIWEPQAFKKVIEFLKNGTQTCPRKFLIHNDTQLIFPATDDVLINANNKEEYKLAIEKLKQK